MGTKKCLKNRKKIFLPQSKNYKNMYLNENIYFFFVSNFLLETLKYIFSTNLKKKIK